MSASPDSSRWICPTESMKRTVKTFPSSRFACQSIPPTEWGSVHFRCFFSEPKIRKNPSECTQKGFLAKNKAERARVMSHISPHIAIPLVSCRNHSNNWHCLICATIESFSLIAFLIETNRSFRIGAMKMTFYRLRPFMLRIIDCQSRGVLFPMRLYPWRWVKRPHWYPHAFRYSHGLLQQ